MAKPKSTVLARSELTAEERKDVARTHLRWCRIVNLRTELQGAALRGDVDASAQLADLELLVLDHLRTKAIASLDICLSRRHEFSDIFNVRPVLRDLLNAWVLHGRDTTRLMESEERWEVEQAATVIGVPVTWIMYVLRDEELYREATTVNETVIDIACDRLGLDSLRHLHRKRTAWLVANNSLWIRDATPEQQARLDRAAAKHDNVMPEIVKTLRELGCTDEDLKRAGIDVTTMKAQRKKSVRTTRSVTRRSR